EQAFAGIYDEISEVYGVDLANEFGHENSAFARKQGFVLEIPAGLVKQNEPLKLEAVVRDSDNAVGRHTINLIVAADEINPEILITQPSPGFGPPEHSDFTLGFGGFDNVKVEQLDLF